jgi:hypothetical protein
MTKKYYKILRYWYHVSTTLSRKEIKLFPRLDGDNRDDAEPRIARICVAPSIEQCLTAVPYTLNDSFNIYRTKEMCMADMPYDVFDAHITQEGWIKVPTVFVKVGRLHFSDIEKALDIAQVVDTAACLADVNVSRKALRWWKKIDINQFVKKTYEH